MVAKYTERDAIEYIAKELDKIAKEIDDFTNPDKINKRDCCEPLRSFKKEVKVKQERCDECRDNLLIAIDDVKSSLIEHLTEYHPKNEKNWGIIRLIKENMWKSFAIGFITIIMVMDYLPKTIIEFLFDLLRKKLGI